MKGWGLAVSLSAALGAALFGYNMGVVSGALLYIVREFDLDKKPQVQGLVVSMASVGAVISTLAAGPASDRFGRRRLLLVTALLFLAGELMEAWSPTVGALIVGRTLVGAAIGAGQMVVPVYIAECAPPSARGALATLPQLTVSTGILLSYAADFLVSLQPHPSWRLMIGFALLPGAVFLALALALPETPVWLSQAGRQEEAEEILLFLHGPSEDSAGEVALSDRPRGRTPGSPEAARERRSRRASEVGSPVSTVSRLESIRKRGSEVEEEEALSLLSHDTATAVQLRREGQLKVGGKHDWDIAEADPEAEDPPWRGSGALGLGGDEHWKRPGAAVKGGGGGVSASRASVGEIWCVVRTVVAHLREPGVRRAFLVGGGLQVFQQICGINAVIFFTPVILKRAGVANLFPSLSNDSGALLATLISYLPKIPSIFLALYLMDRKGRRSLLLSYSLPLMTLALLSLSISISSIPSDTTQSLHTDPSQSPPPPSPGSMFQATVAILSISLYGSSFVLGLGPIPSIVCAEIFPTPIRGAYSGACLILNWMSMFVVTQTFPALLSALGMSWLLVVYAAACVAAWVFLHRLLPETKGLPLEVIPRLFESS